MSAIRLRSVQYGTHTTAANNFVLKTPDTPDQTLRLYRGSLDSLSTQILSIGSDNRITFTSNIVGNLTGNADTVTNGVYTLGNQSIGGIKTFTSSPYIQTGAEAALHINANSISNYSYQTFQQGGATRWALVTQPTTPNFSIDRYVSGAYVNSPFSIINGSGDILLSNTGGTGGWVYVRNKFISGPYATPMDATSTTGFEIQNNGGTGDSALAGMNFHCTGTYALKMGLRSDGTFGIGGWSRGVWSWYTDPSGNMVAAGSVTQFSDPKLKENFERVKDPLGLLRALDGGTFNWKSGVPHIEVKAGKRDYGILADQVEAVMPEIVTQSIDIAGERYKMVSYEKLIPVLVEAIRVLEARVIELEGK